MSCSLCSSAATHRCTKEPRVYCKPHAGVGRCCVTFAEFERVLSEERARLRRCATPACSSVIPAQLDARGALGWHDLVVELRPLGHSGNPMHHVAEPVTRRICPACSNDRTIVVALAVAALLP